MAEGKSEGKPRVTQVTEEEGNGDASIAPVVANLKKGKTSVSKKLVEQEGGQKVAQVTEVAKGHKTKTKAVVKPSETEEDEKPKATKTNSKHSKSGGKTNSAVTYHEEHEKNTLSHVKLSADEGRLDDLESSVSQVPKKCKPAIYLAGSYAFLLLMSVLFGALLALYSQEIVFSLCFGGCAVILGCIAVLVSAGGQVGKYADADVESLDESAEEIWSCNNTCNIWMEFLSRDQNAIKLFMLVEASIDIYFGAIITEQVENVTAAEGDVAVFVIGSASSAIFLILLSILLSETVYKGEVDEGYVIAEAKKCPIVDYCVDSLFTIAIVLNDLADVLLLSTTLVTEEFSVKELVDFIFLLANVFIAEAAVAFSFVPESWADNDVSKDFKPSLADTQLLRLQRSGKMASAARRKTRAQTSVTGLLVIPFVLAFGVLRDDLSAEEQLWITALCLTGLPVLLTMATDMFYFYAIPGTPFQLQEIGPKLLALLLIATYAGVDEVFPSLEARKQQTTFLLYFAYIALPMSLRALIDFYRYRSLRYRLAQESANFEEHTLSNFDLLCISLLLRRNNKLPEVKQLKNHTYVAFSK